MVIELKTQLADQLQQQGVSIDPNSVTDEMLYNEIATDPMVRAEGDAVSAGARVCFG